VKITLLAFAPLFCALLPALVRAQSADEIMARVAENQTRAETARASFVYRQDVLVRQTGARRGSRVYGDA
jgi:hypothetical protein